MSAADKDDYVKCGARAIGGRCVLPAGHNMGRADVPENHSADFDYSEGQAHVCRCGRPYRSEPKEWCPDMTLHHQHDPACCEPTFDHYGYAIVKVGDVPPWMEPIGIADERRQRIQVYVGMDELVDDGDFFVYRVAPTRS